MSNKMLHKQVFGVYDALEDMTGLQNKQALVWHQPGVVICMGQMWAEWGAVAGVYCVFLMSPAGGETRLDAENSAAELTGILQGSAKCC